VRRKLLPAAALLFGTLLTGCAVNGAGFVRIAPQPPRYATIGVAPGPGWIWAAGNWDWLGGRWGWVEGSWMRPPRARVVWIPG
jgi:hypothetical protein